MKRNQTFWLWPAASFALSLLSSSTGGRALWCDEILRINGQHYTLGQLFAFQHLHDFCTQTPTAYLFMRPFQLLLGYEPGGNLVAALSAAVIVASVLCLLRRRKDGEMPSALACAVVALNPLLIYYGSELSFYGMFAAAFAVAFAFAVTLEDGTDSRGRILRAVGCTVAGALFITFHFAGMFVWAGFAAVLCLDCLVRSGIKRAFHRGLLMAVPMAVNIPMYLGAEGKAIHLGTQHVAWDKLPGLPLQLWKYLSSLFPSLTGGGLVGVAVFAVGLVLMFRNRRTRQAAVLALAAILSVLFFLSYSGLHGYIPFFGRYWVYALAPTLLVVALAVDGTCGWRRWLGVAGASLVLAADLATDSVLLLAKGRSCPYLEFQRAVPPDAPAVVYVNHYEMRFFGQYYALSPGTVPVCPSYWEQGDRVRERGLELIHDLAPLCPVYIQDDQQEKMARDAGWAGRCVCETPSLPLRVVRTLHLYPEPAYAELPSTRLLVPTETDVLAAAETKGAPAFVPGRGWRLAVMRPDKADRPFTPVLALGPGQRAELKVYVPKSWSGSQLTLKGLMMRGASAATPFSVSLDATKKGGYVSTWITGGKEGCFFFAPLVQ